MDATGGLQILVRSGEDVTQLAETYAEVTGNRVRVVEKPAEDLAGAITSLAADMDNVVVWGQWGGQAPIGWESTTYGRDYSCVVADNAWFAVNRQAPPTSTADLLDARWAPLTEVSSPLQSDSSLRWIAGAGRDNPAAIQPFLDGLKGAGVTLVRSVNPSVAQSGEQSPGVPENDSEPRLRVASALEPWLTVNNLGTSSRWVTVPETCVGTELSLWGTGPKSEDFVQFLLSDRGQSALVEAGLAYPVVETAQIPPAVLSVAPIPGTEGAATVEIPAAEAATLTDAVVTAWAAVVGQ